MNKSQKLHGWIARDMDGSLWFHYIKPHRENDIEKTWWGSNDIAMLLDDDTLYPELTWEDNPYEVELIIKIL